MADWAGILAAKNTLKSGTLKLWMARLFGRKTTYEQEGYMLTISEWRGEIYLTSYRQADE